ncbi:cyclin-dependent kinase 10-like [Uloborus diversus]|uniref:cyclin-dependent kinase 10-like n=1 Tax=Uloborus diversus TaxID=327109 RepID=UPI00240A414D|nr:cyclin-dependent kinase 10-like [Uloborus diversus]
MAAKIPGLDLPLSENDGAGIEFGNFHILHKDLHGRCRDINHFEDFSKIKEGDFGTFYSARDKEKNKWVIMKSYNLDKDLNSDSYTMVTTEINVLQTMAHRNLVTVLEVVSGESCESIWLVFEFYQHSLMDLLKYPSFLVPHLVKKIMEEILLGLKYLHSADYCHGNLNPDNILFDNSGVLKISDYTNPSIYHETTPLDDSDDIIDPILNMTLETCVLRYKPLDILMGCKKQHPAMDMWAVGCIFAELLLKKPLFPHSSVKDLCADIINLLGYPNDLRLPGFSELLQRNNTQVVDYRRGTKLQKRFIEQGTTCTHLLAALLVYNPRVRCTAEECLAHQYFREEPTAGSNENVAHLLKAVQEMTLQIK